MKIEELKRNPGGGSYLVYDLVVEAKSLGVDGKKITKFIETDDGVEALCKLTEKLKTT